MKKNRILLVGFVLLVAVIVLAQQNPSFRSFNPGHFETNAVPWPIALKSNLTLTNLTVLTNLFVNDLFWATNTVTVQSNLIVEQSVFVSNNIVFQGTPLDPLALWLPSVSFQLWYEPFSGSANASGTIGKMGWTASSSGAGGIGISNGYAPNHFGTTVIITSGALANSGETIFLGDTLNGQPPLPALNATAGWTNRFIWRVTNATNAFRSYIHLANGNVVNFPIENGIGIMINSTNSNQVQGFCSNSSSQTRTNLGPFALDTWITNYVWCATAGTISFSLNDGPEATISANLPTGRLTPHCEVVTTSASAATFLEMDEWVMWLNLAP